MANVKSIRALERGLTVLRHLDESGGSSLHELHVVTGLSKATLLRILKTLEEQAWVHCAMGEQLYRLGTNVRAVGSRLGREQEIAELATPILERLCSRIAWPSDIAIFNGSTMEIMETTRSKSPFLVNREVMRIRPRMLWSALGRVYLAYCPDAERDAILASLRRASHHDDRAAQNRAWVTRLLAETRAQGYGTREPGYWVNPVDLDFDMTAIAVPVMVGAQVVACININWIADALPLEEGVRSYLQPLNAAAGDLARRLSARHAAA